MSKFWTFVEDYDNTQPIDEDNTRFTVGYNSEQALSDMSGLMVDGDVISPRSIPSPWARPWLFQEYLNKKNDAGVNIKEALISQWRGFLAMLALYPIYREWNVTRTDISVSLESRRNSIDKTIMSFKPEIPEGCYPFEYNANWDEIHIIKVGGKVVGMTSPTTLICPGNKPENLKAPWIDENGFCDPVSKLSRGERIILYSWLKSIYDKVYDDLLNELKNQGNTITEIPPEKKPLIFKQIEGYMSSLHLKSSDKNLCESANIIPTVGTSIYEILGNRVRLDSPANSSELRLANIPEEVIILGMQKGKDGSNPETKGMEKLIYGFLDGAMYKRMQKEGTPVSSIIDQFGGNTHNFIDPDTIFLKKCYKFATQQTALFNINKSSKETGIHKVDSDGMRYSLPISKDICNVLGKSLLNEIVLDLANVNTASYSIKLQLIAGGFINIQKHYLTDDIIKWDVKGADLPITVLYPRVEGCSTYYLNNSIKGKNYYLAPIEKGIEASTTTSSYTLSKYPVYLGFYDKSTDGYVGALDISDTMVPVKKVNDDIKYAFDFGTSSSVVGIKVGTGTPKLLNFSDDISYIISSQKEDINELGNVLFPYAKIQSPFSTIYYAQHSELNPRSIVDGHPFFRTKTETVEDVSNYVCDLKINSDLNNGNDVKGNQLRLYILQIFMMILVDAKSKGKESFEVNVAYPLSIKHLKTYQTVMNEQFLKACEIIGYDTNDVFIEGMQDENKKIKFLKSSESLAASQSFNHDHQINGEIVIDIGGGTTDVYILVNNSGKAEKANLFSVRTGAREMLIKLFKLRPSILAILMSKIDLEEAGFDSTFKNRSKYREMSDSNRFELLVETILNWEYRNKTIGDIMISIVRDNYDKSTSSELQLLKTILSFQVLSIIYYCGMLFKSVDSQVNQKHDLPIKVNFCGNGSKILKWLAVEEDLEEYVTEFCRYGSDMKDKTFHVEFSEIPKSEISIGLLSDALDNIRNSNHFILGEECFYKGKTVNANKIIENGNSLDIDSVNEELPVYSEFLSNLGINIDDNDKIIPCKYVKELELMPIVFEEISKSEIGDGIIKISKTQVLAKLDNSLRKMEADQDTNRQPIFMLISEAIKSEMMSSSIWKE